MGQARLKHLLSMAEWWEVQTNNLWPPGLREQQGLMVMMVREWEGTVWIWVDNDNVVRGLEKRLGIEKAGAV